MLTMQEANLQTSTLLIAIENILQMDISNNWDAYQNEIVLHKIILRVKVEARVLVSHTVKINKWLRSIPSRTTA